MSVRKEIIKVADEFDFRYEVSVDHYPHLGFSNALYGGRLIVQVELGRIHEPFNSDDDSEWEAYEERFGEWRDEILVNMDRKCKEHFNRDYRNKYKR